VAHTHGKEGSIPSPCTAPTIESARPKEMLVKMLTYLVFIAGFPAAAIA